MQWCFFRQQTSARVDQHVPEGQKVAQQRCQPHLFSNAHWFYHNVKAKCYHMTIAMQHSIA